MIKIKKLFFSVLVLAICIGNISACTDQKGTEENYSLGKTPYSYLGTFGEGFVLYKDNVSGENANGLYFQRIEGAGSVCPDRTLISDAFYACANIYRDDVIFINTDYQIQQQGRDGKSCEIIYDNRGKSIMDLLVVNDTLYFIAEIDDGIFGLWGMDLSTKNTNLIAKQINPHYLYHCQEDIVVLTKDMSKRLVCSTANGVIETAPNPEDEIQGFSDDGEIILSRNRNTIYKIGRGNREAVLVEKDNIYRTITHGDEILICTLDKFGLIEIFIYDFIKGEMEKIANANYVPEDFNDEFILCIPPDGIGNVELIHRETGDIETIYINTWNSDLADQGEEADTSLGETSGDGDHLSEEDVAIVLGLAKEYYREKHGWEIFDYQIVNDENHPVLGDLYKLYGEEYGMENVLILEVHTSHNPSGPYRSITYVRKDKNAKWEWKNEGE